MSIRCRLGFHKWSKICLPYVYQKGHRKDIENKIAMNYFILEDSASRKRVFMESLNIPGNGVTVCDSVEASKRILSERSFDVIFLDHDLDGRTYVPINEPNAGYQLALWISENDIPGKIIIHSYNEFAVPEMLKVLPQAVWEPFNPEGIRKSYGTEGL